MFHTENTTSRRGHCTTIFETKKELGVNGSSQWNVLSHFSIRVSQIYFLLKINQLRVDDVNVNVRAFNTRECTTFSNLEKFIHFHTWQWKLSYRVIEISAPGNVIILLGPVYLRYPNKMWGMVQNMPSSKWPMIQFCTSSIHPRTPVDQKEHLPTKMFSPWPTTKTIQLR